MSRRITITWGTETRKQFEAIQKVIDPENASATFRHIVREMHRQLKKEGRLK